MVGFLLLSGYRLFDWSAFLISRAAPGAPGSLRRWTFADSLKPLNLFLLPQKLILFMLQLFDLLHSPLDRLLSFIKQSVVLERTKLFHLLLHHFFCLSAPCRWSHFILVIDQDLIIFFFCTRAWPTASLDSEYWLWEYTIIFFWSFVMNWSLTLLYSTATIPLALLEAVLSWSAAVSWIVHAHFLAVGGEAFASSSSWISDCRSASSGTLLWLNETLAGYWTLM